MGQFDTEFKGRPDYQEALNRSAGIIIYGNNHGDLNMQGAHTLSHFLYDLTDDGEPLTFVFEHVGQTRITPAMRKDIAENGLVYSFLKHDSGYGRQGGMPHSQFRELLEVLQETGFVLQPDEEGSFRYGHYHLAHVLDLLRAEGRPVTVGFEGPYKGKLGKKIETSLKAIERNSTAMSMAWESGDFDQALAARQSHKKAIARQLELRDGSIARQCERRRIKRPHRRSLQVVGAGHLPGIQAALSESDADFSIVNGLYQPNHVSTETDDTPDANAQVILLIQARRRLKQITYREGGYPFYMYLMHYETAGSHMRDAISESTYDEIRRAFEDSEASRNTLVEEFAQLGRSVIPEKFD